MPLSSYMASSPSAPLRPPPLAMASTSRSGRVLATLCQSKKCPLCNLENYFPGVPPGSKVVCTDNAYMPDKTWVELAHFIAQGIQLMPHNKDHTDLQVCLTLDGFSCHLVPAGLSPFTAANIAVIKEEGDTLQVNQAPSIRSISGKRRQEDHLRVT